MEIVELTHERIYTQSNLNQLYSCNYQIPQGYKLVVCCEFLNLTLYARVRLLDKQGKSCKTSDLYTCHKEGDDFLMTKEEFEIKYLNMAICDALANDPFV